MNFRKLRTRIENALSESIDSGVADADDLAGILEALLEGPMQPGDTVDASGFRQRVDPLFGERAIVQACWIDEDTARWWVAVRDPVKNYCNSGDAMWFTKVEDATSTD